MLQNVELFLCLRPFSRRPFEKDAALCIEASPSVRPSLRLCVTSTVIDFKSQKNGQWNRLHWGQHIIVLALAAIVQIC